MAHGTRIGLLGGTFDPIHWGHIRLARAARDMLALDEVLLAPTGSQPLKAEPAAASWPDRMRMAELAVTNEINLKTSTIDAPRSGHNYSVDTVAALRRTLPEYVQIWLVMGADAFEHFLRWKSPGEILAMADLAVASRPGYLLPKDSAELLRLLPGGSRFLGREQIAAAQAFVFLCGGAMVRIAEIGHLDEDISATELRHSLAQNREWQWLPPQVAEYVRAHHLYGA